MKYVNTLTSIICCKTCAEYIITNFNTFNDILLRNYDKTNLNVMALFIFNDQNNYAQ